MTPARIHTLNFVRRFTVVSILFLIPLHFVKIGFSGWQVGAVVSLFSFAPLLLSFPTGWVNDRFSMRRVIQGSLLILAAGIFFIGRTRDFYAMAGLFLVLGMAYNALDVSVNSLYYKLPTRLSPNRKYGMLVFWSSLGMAAGLMVGGALTFLADFNAMFAMNAVILLSVVALSRDREGEKFEAVAVRDYRLDLVNARTMQFALVLFVLSLHWGAEGTVYSPFLKEYFGLNNLKLALYIALPLVALAFAAFFIGLIPYDARTNNRLFMGAMAVSGLGHILMVSRSLYVSFGFRVVHEIGDGILGALTVLYISGLFAKRSIGGSSGMLLTVTTLGQTAGALAFSSLGFHYGLQYPFIVSGILLVANSGFAWYFLRRETGGRPGLDAATVSSA